MGEFDVQLDSREVEEEIAKRQKEREEMGFVKHELAIDSKSLDDVKKEIIETLENKQYRNELIRKTLGQKPLLRRTFAIVLSRSPARIGEIQEKVFITRKSIYTHLYQLKELGLVDKIAVMDIWNKRNLKGAQKEVMQKFKDFSSTMSEGQVQYFAAKTNYWVLTELGEDTKIINWVLRLEKEFKNE